MTRKQPIPVVAQALPERSQMTPVEAAFSTEEAHIDTYNVHTSLLFDPLEKRWLRNAVVEVNKQNGLINRVSEGSKALAIRDGDVDLRGYTVLPGLVDAHSHIFLHDYKEATSLYQMRDESFVERVVRATNHCRSALLAGYTTYRDLGTEGLFSADASFRDTINRGLTPGPRLFVATEALASSSGYAIRTESSFPPSMQTSSSQGPLSTIPVRISDPCDGPYSCRAAVRRRLGAGADLIKFYADYRKRTLRYPGPAYPGGPKVAHPPEESGFERNASLTLFTQEEMDAIVDEAKRAHCPVAAHASIVESVIMAANAGVTSVEHGYMRSDEAIAALKENGTIFVPTLAVVESSVGAGAQLDEAKAQTLAAYKAGVVLATGGDTGAFAHGENVREVELMLEAGVPLDDVLVAATLGGWKACGGEWCGRRFGGIKEGWAADFVALEGDLREEKDALRKVKEVVKDGVVVVRGGKLVV